MSEFQEFNAAVQKQLDKMCKGDVFVVDLGKDILRETYLSSFAEGDDPLFRERTEHDCNCCKQFVGSVGGLVSVTKDNKLMSIWDVNVGGKYQKVADALAALVKSAKIRDVFLTDTAKVGTVVNYQATDEGTLTWHHFNYKFPSKFVMRSKDSIPSAFSTKRSDAQVFKRSLEEMSTEAAEIVADLIAQNSLYRGSEHKGIVTTFVKFKNIYDGLDDDKKDAYCWSEASKMGGAARIRNTVIGTLMTDISNDVELDAAVRSFEAKVAPTNYKRPTALVTKKMIENAKKKVDELGIQDSLARRYAVTDDITINNVLFADRTVKQALNVFDEMASDIAVNTKKLKKVEEIDIETFIKDILPTATALEMLVENKHSSNLMSLVAPQDVSAPSILKWDNNFTWAYNGELTDSIKERVKNAGGDVDGVMRCSLSWFNHDDLDIHVVEPKGGSHIYYGHKHSPTSGKLDVDMNAGSGTSRNAVENITWSDLSRMKEGRYKVYINNFSKRESVDVGFDAEIEYNGVIHSFHYDKAVPARGNVTVAEFDFSKKDGIKFVKSLPEQSSSKEVWGINTQQFVKVDMVMTSPNHWDDNEVGNKHYFFILDKCVSPNDTRGFFNEFLKEELREHRKVFEILGSKMKVAESDEQLSGVGFSTTQRNSVVCKVTGTFDRTVKINF